MRLVERHPEALLVELSEDDLVAITNALNEILHGPEAIPDWEFPTRIGLTREVVAVILQSLVDLTGDAPRPNRKRHLCGV